MKLIKPYYEILTPINGDEILKTIEKISRTCYKSEDKITENSAQKMIKSLIIKGHEAMIEFFDITVKFICDRGVSHEIVRHRLASYAQESTRYCNYSKKIIETIRGKENHIQFIILCWLNIPEHICDSKNDIAKINDENIKLWMNAMFEAEIYYNTLIGVQKWQPQQARSVLPNSLKTEINVKMNLREWKHFFKLRTSPAAHPQMREIAIPLLIELKYKIPIIFDDIII